MRIEVFTKYSSNQAGFSEYNSTLGLSMVASNLVLSVVSNSKVQNFHVKRRISSRMKNLHPPHTLTVAKLVSEGREVLSKKRNFVNAHNFQLFHHKIGNFSNFPSKNWKLLGFPTQKKLATFFGGTKGGNFSFKSW